MFSYTPNSTSPPPTGHPNSVRSIIIRGAKQHNLKNLSLDLPREQLIIFTGVSGSGKSSLAFDTLFAEGQRRYVESLSPYARQFLAQLPKPDVEHIEGLPPTIAVEQRASQANPRSTVATATEIYDYLRLMFSRVGVPHCPVCGEVIARQTASEIIDHVRTYREQTRVMVLAPLVRNVPGDHKAALLRIKREGFSRARIDGVVQEIGNIQELEHPHQPHTVEIVVDRFVVNPNLGARLGDSIELALRLGDGRVVISRQAPSTDPLSPMPWQDERFSELLVCSQEHVAVPPLEPRWFSFNSPEGACPKCSGLGTTLDADPELVVPNVHLSWPEAIEPWRKEGGRLGPIFRAKLQAFADKLGLKTNIPFKDLPDVTRNLLLFGPSETHAHDERLRGWEWEGVLPSLSRRYHETDSEGVREKLRDYLSEHDCVECKGQRLNPTVRAVTLGGYNISQFCALNVADAVKAINEIATTMPKEAQQIAAPMVQQISNRLKFLQGVGLNYLTLDRRSDTLSGGEAQRIRLATQVGAGLVGVAYVLDEPSIGLHQRDNARLLETLKHLRDLGNTVIVVEHDPDFILAGQHIVELGPGPGHLGGELVFQGDVAGLKACETSLTGAYLCGRKRIATRPSRRRVNPNQALKVLKACENNLKNIDVTFPLYVLLCVSGVSGSGKSTLVTEILLKSLQRNLNGAKVRVGKHDAVLNSALAQKVVEIDQSPIGRTPRSNPATYTGVFNEMREVFAMTKEAKVRGYDASRFSFNVKGGRCEACQGQGTKRIEMHFLADMYVTCESCKGQRFNRETLEIRYKGKTIADVLDMTISEAQDFFHNFPKLARMLKTLNDVGLGYLRLGQSADTLSGGEAQRVKLAAELGKPDSEHTIYILDEPSTGLHFADVARLLDVLNRLVDAGHSVIVIEHNLDVLRSADWIIDLGPEGGAAGGTVVAEGTPEEIARNRYSHTGRFLRQYFPGTERGDFA